jgi:hypothetical protein
LRMYSQVRKGCNTHDYFILFIHSKKPLPQTFASGGASIVLKK